MTTRNIAGFFLIPLVLLVTAWVVNAHALWSFVGNLTVPWFCTALALAVLVVGVTCLLLQRPPAAIPTRHATLVVAAVLSIVGIGFIVDGQQVEGSFKSSEVERELADEFLPYAEPPDWLSSAGEWIGFAVILGGVFWLPRIGVPASEV